MKFDLEDNVRRLITVAPHASSTWWWTLPRALRLKPLRDGGRTVILLNPGVYPVPKTMRIRDDQMLRPAR